MLGAAPHRPGAASATGQRRSRPPPPRLRAITRSSQALEAASWSPTDVNVQFADLLAQGIAIEPEHVRGLELIAARRQQGARDQRTLDLAKQPVIDTGRRQRSVVRTEIAL